MNDHHQGAPYGAGQPASTFLARVIAAAAQGLLLYALIKAKADQPAFALDKETWKRLLETLYLFALYAPLPLLFGLGNLPLRKLVPWSLIAAIGVLVFGWFAAAPAWTGAPTATWLFSLIVIFILHEFVQAAHDDGRRIASYETYFDRSWRHGFQAVLSIGFAAAFWLVISLGATMFRLIGLEIIPRAIFSDFFRSVATPIAFAIGLHLTDADTGLTRGARQIGLALLSWLAILMSLILAAFLAALPFTGLEPLWDTKRATVLLLNAAATMILLINAAYQAGDPPRNAVMRAVVRFSAIPLAGIVALAALGLYMRVNQYGFTPARVLAGAELLIVAVYAIGYLAAALRPGVWLSMVRPVNIAAALFVAAILTALMTPLMDPARVAIADQVARLDRGAVEPDDFDFGFLADQRSGAWGKAALEKLAARTGSERDARIALLAKNPVARDPYAYGGGEQTFNERRASLALIGAGDIPDAALLPQAGDDPVTACVQSMKAFAEERRLEAERARQRARLGRRATETAAEAAEKQAAANGAKPVVSETDPEEGRCPARRLDLDLDGDDDLLILSNQVWRGDELATFAILNNGETWRYAGTANAAMNKEQIEADARNPNAGRAARRAAFERLEIAPHRWRDVIAGGTPLRLRDVMSHSPLEAGRIQLLDDAPLPPAALAVALAYNARQFCDEDCFGKRLAAGVDGRIYYSVIAVRYGGRTNVALFDAEGGALVAIGNGQAGDWSEGSDIGDAAARAAHIKGEYRRIAEGATTAPPLLGDIILDGKPLRVAYLVVQKDFSEISER